tara:strand:- start:3209 stop:3556 length:348 start_codon:yes stop_codon:yes gene_type:complete
MEAPGAELAMAYSNLGQLSMLADDPKQTLCWSEKTLEIATPRGPQLATRSNPGGLTRRQMTVLALIAEGLSNADIADRLFVSAKTVDHHVSAILAKLNARTRGQAVAFARTKELI